MSVKIVRPGDKDFAEAYRNCKPVIPFDALDTKTKRTVYANGNFVDEVCLASHAQARSVVVAIKKSDFEYYFRRNLAQLTWEKSYVASPDRGVIRSGDISTGTITQDKLTVGYGATEARHYSDIANAMLKHCEADSEFTKEYYLTEEKKEMNHIVDNKLYLVIGEGPHKGKYVTKIAINKANEFVVEAKGENAYFSVKETDLERVLPYSVDVRFMAPNGAALNGRVYSYWSNPGDVDKGDVIFSTDYGNPMIVVAVDTKAESATKFLTGSVMKPAKVLEGK